MRLSERAYVSVLLIWRGSVPKPRLMPSTTITATDIEMMRMIKPPRPPPLQLQKLIVIIIVTQNEAQVTLSYHEQ